MADVQAEAASKRVAEAPHSEVWPHATKEKTTFK